MNRIFSSIVAASVGVLLLSVLVACLWRPHGVGMAPEGAIATTPSANVVQERQSDVASPDRPTLAPPRPTLSGTEGLPEQGVVYGTVEVQVDVSASQ